MDASVIRTAIGDYRLEAVGGGRMALATVELRGGQRRALAMVHSGDAQRERLASIAAGHHARSAAHAAAEGSDRFLGEVLAYVRALPDGSRSPYIDDEDPEWASAAVADVRRALGSALVQTDPYRAAKAFEQSCPYLEGDVRLVSLMAGVLRAHAVADRSSHAAEAAREMEEEAGASSMMVRRQVEMWRGASPSR